MGWTAAHGSLTVEALVLFAILFSWQFPHFLAIAWLYREDYERGGFKMLPQEDPSGIRTARRILLFSVLLLAFSLLPTILTVSGPFYFAAAGILGLYFFLRALGLALDPARASARRLLRASIFYLPLLFLAMNLDKV
jgi:protoheme IX farnesyltransferase